MSTNTDARARRTRERLSEALQTMMPDSSRQLPSVAALVAEAGVTRSAFYSHFSSVEDLAVHVLSEAFAGIGNTDIDHRVLHTMSPRETTTFATRRLVEHVLSHRALYEWLLVNAGATAYYRVVDDFAARTRATLDVAFQLPDDADSAVIADYFAGGVLNTLRRALMDGSSLSASQLTENLVGLVPHWFVDTQE